MSYPTISEPGSSFKTLRRLAQPLVAQERCDFCNAALSPGHRHLLESVDRKIICACDPCALRFQDVVGGRFKLIPRDAQALPDFQMTDAQWDSLALPINLAFFFYSTVSGQMTALYPSPAGATESLLPLDHWRELVADNPALAEIEPDVEALLINRVGQAREYFIAPMDVCYELVGLIRTHWRGLSGGETVWVEIEKFFARFRTEPLPVAPQMEAGHA